MNTAPKRFSRQSSLGAAVAAGLLIALAGGCSVAPRAPHSASAPPQAEAAPAHIALVPLSRAIERERRRPSQEAMKAPLPPGVDPALAMPVEGDSRSQLSLDDAIALFAAKELPAVLTAAPAAMPAERDRREAALRRYLAGRQRLFDGDLSGGIEDLRQATRLDPEAPEPWRELGEAYIAQSSRVEAVAAFRTAVSRGLNDPRVLEILGRDALERHEQEAAAQFFTRALLADPESADPLLPHVIEVGLAGALAGQGYITAARDAVRRALERSAPAAVHTRYLQEYGSIFRRQGDLWREVGDAECRLGHYESALEAYRRAAGLPTINEEALLGRTVFAAMRAGRPAVAAAAVVEAIIENGGLAGDTEVSLLRHIAGNGPDGSAGWNSPVRLETAAALATYRQSLGPDATPTVARAMVRAQAAVLGAVAARPLLREYFVQQGADVSVASDLIAACSSSAEAAREAAQVVAVAPAAADEMAEAVLRSRFDVQEVLAHLLRGPATPARVIVAAHIHARAGMFAAASRLADAIPLDGSLAEATSLAKFDFGISAGFERSPEQYAFIPTSPQGARMAARIYAAAQQHQRALSVLEPFLADIQGGVARRERIDTLIVAAELAAAAGRADDAERWLRQAISLDHHDERAYSHLLGLYAPSGPRPDAGRTAQVLRDLRAHTQDSRTARILVTRELLRRNLLPQAEAAALDLADESADLAAIEVLASVWQLRAASGDQEAFERALQWIEQERKRRPYAAALLAGATTVLVGAGRGEEAVTLLREAMDAGAGRDAARLLERVMREVLGRPAEADTLATARLEGRTLLPADSLELAEALARLGRDADACDALAAMLDPAITLVGDQPGRVLNLLAFVSERLLALGPALLQQPELHTRAVDLFSQAADRGLQMPPALVERQLRLVAADPRSSFEHIRAVAAHAVQQQPSLRWRPYAVAAHVAGAAGRGDIALQLIEDAVAQSQRPDAELLGEWFIFIVMAGSAQDGRRMIESLHSSGRLIEVLERFEVRVEPGADPRALAAFLLANEFAGRGNEDDAVATYELVLSFDPRSAWAANNLGYMLLERESDLQRADELLSLAYEIMPNEIPIIDSIGWLRYLQGRLNDELDPENGKVVREGALSLLSRAARSPEGRENPTILDHYGDALYRAGRADQAVRLWRSALSRANSEVNRAELLAARRQQENPGAPQPVDRRVQGYREIARAAQAKLEAHRGGRPVPVAPLPGETPPADAQPQQPAGQQPEATEPRAGGPGNQH
jgi:tetratricopeptide (TPR) repeat protein